MSRDQFWLTKAQFSKIKPHLPTDTRGKARVDARRVISGIVQVLKSGARWLYGACSIYRSQIRRRRRGLQTGRLCRGGHRNGPAFRNAGHHRQDRLFAVEGLYLLVGEDPVRAGLVASMNPARPGNGCELLHKAIWGASGWSFLCATVPSAHTVGLAGQSAFRECLVT